jgi:hypothetical protein
MLNNLARVLLISCLIVCLSEHEALNQLPPGFERYALCCGRSETGDIFCTQMNAFTCRSLNGRFVRDCDLCTPADTDSKDGNN